MKVISYLHYITARCLQSLARSPCMPGLEAHLLLLSDSDLCLAWSLQSTDAHTSWPDAVTAASEEVGNNV